MSPRTLTQSQYHLCRILWRDGPMDELQLLTRCQEELGWRRTAARRLLRELESQGMVRHRDGMVAAAVAEEETECSPAVICRALPAVCPLAFGETGVKSRIRRVMHYKKPPFWIAIAAVAVCIAAAVCFLTVPAQGVSPNLQFQDLPWNMPMEEVLDWLDASGVAWEMPDVYTRLSQPGGGGVEAEPYDIKLVYIYDWEVFGETASEVTLTFMNATPEPTDYYGLSSVTLLYPDSCDKAAILDNVRETYGPEAERYTLYDVITGEPEEYVQAPGAHYWFSQLLLEDVLSEEGQAAYRDYLESIQSDDPDKELAAYLARPAAYISWHDAYISYPKTEPDSPGTSGLYLYGGSMVTALQWFEQAASVD